MQAATATIIGSRLTELRKAKGVNQGAVAKAAKVTKAAISGYEKGIRVPRDETKARLANYFEVSVEEIFFTH